MRRQGSISGYAQLALVGLLWGSSSLLIRLIDQTPQFITFGRYAFGALAVAAWGLLSRKRDWSPGDRPWVLIAVAAWMAVTTAHFQPP